MAPLPALPQPQKSSRRTTPARRRAWGGGDLLTKAERTGRGEAFASSLKTHTGRDWAFGPDHIKRAGLFRRFFLASKLRRSQAPARHASAGGHGIVWSLRSLLRGLGLAQSP